MYVCVVGDFFFFFFFFGGGGGGVEIKVYFSKRFKKSPMRIQFVLLTGKGGGGGGEKVRSMADSVGCQRDLLSFWVRRFVMIDPGL